VLASGDKGGTVCLTAHGFFLVGRVKLGAEHVPLDSEHADGRPICIASLCMNARMENLTVGVAIDDGAATMGATVAVTTVETPLLASGTKEIYALALHCRAVTQLLQHTRRALNLVAQHWLDGFGGLFDGLAKKLLELTRMSDPSGRGLDFLTGQVDDGARDKDLWKVVQKELVALFTCGVMSRTLRQFLLRDMQVSTVKKLQRTLETTVGEIFAVLDESVGAAVQLLCFHLSELRESPPIFNAFVAKYRHRRPAP
jgi:hypothetical protein